MRACTLALARPPAPLPPLRPLPSQRDAVLSARAAMLAFMAEDYVTGREHELGDAPKMSDSVRRDLPAPGWAHAVARQDAEGSRGPWRAVCGATVRVIRGEWTSGRGLGFGRPCPECRALALT
jgi:hypothetical protein